MAQKTQPNENTTTQKSKVVSVKLPIETQTQLETEAAENGISLSELMRQKLEQSKAQTQKELPPVAAGTPTPQVATLDDVTQVTFLKMVAETVKNSLPNIEVTIPVEPSPVNEYLKEILGLEPESENTLTPQAKEFLNNLTESIKADLRTDWLKENKSVLYPLSTNKLQLEMFNKMLERREETATEKIPSFTSVFQNALAKAFFENANSLYNSMLFKATYGFDYNEFKAVFEI
jgi:hypothetical protein